MSSNHAKYEVVQGADEVLSPISPISPNNNNNNNEIELSIVHNDEHDGLVHIDNNEYPFDVDLESNSPMMVALHEAGEGPIAFNFPPILDQLYGSNGFLTRYLTPTYSKYMVWLARLLPIVPILAFLGDIIYRIVEEKEILLPIAFATISSVALIYQSITGFSLGKLLLYGLYLSGIFVIWCSAWSIAFFLLGIFVAAGNTILCIIVQALWAFYASQILKGQGVIRG